MNISAIDKAGDQSFYDYVRSGAVDLPAIMEAAETATGSEAESISTLVDYLKNDESAIRYWGATGLLILGEDARPALDKLIKASTDPSGDVAVVAAEAIYNLGETEKAKKALLKVLENPNEFARCHALNAIDCIEEKSPEIIDGVVKLVTGSGDRSPNAYDLRAAKWLIEKWGLDPDEYEFSFEW